MNKYWDSLAVIFFEVFHVSLLCFNPTLMFFFFIVYVADNSDDIKKKIIIGNSVFPPLFIWLPLWQLFKISIGLIHMQAHALVLEPCF